MPRRRAFTMIELLVVMGIIVLLIAILMPALGKAREAANAVTCSSHIKNLTNAFLLFANDHNNHLPGTRRTWRGGDQDPQHQDWLFGIYSAWDEYPGNTMMQRIDCAPQYGTIWPYVKDENVYKCPSMNVERPGSGIGSNGRFDYAAFSIFCGTTVRSVRPISQLHRPCITRTVTTDASGQTVTQITETLPGPDTNDPNVKMDPMTVEYQNRGFAGAVENMPTPLVCQEEPGMSINYDPNGNVFVHHDNGGDDDWWSQMDGAHQHWDQMSHVHGGGSYYGAIDGSVVFVIEPDTDQWIGTWSNGVGQQGIYGEGASLWWQKGPATNIPRPMNWDPGAYQPDAVNAPNNWVSGWNWWSRQ